MKISFILSLLLLISSCQEKVFYTKTYSFNKNVWSRKVLPKFAIDIKDTLSSYDFNISFRSTTDYSYSNCWIFIYSISPDKKKSKEAFEIKFAREDGTWIGKKTGSIVEHKITFPNKKFPMKGKYQFIIEQAVIQKELKELLDITFIVNKRTKS
ncbi:MAG: gliding motility lipoprotein GldH [Flavobacteriia bacterium]|nr:gliding motility lipoprotein GldH [Flavobacteriia bacterium]